MRPVLEQLLKTRQTPKVTKQKLTSRSFVLPRPVICHSSLPDHKAM